MKFQAYLPHPLLRPYIQCYSTVYQPPVSGQTPLTETVPPLPTKYIVFWWRKTPTYFTNKKNIDGSPP
ncbi:MAG: hypothetical protein AAFP08_09885, partial [Bacteroidota bacterium]